MKIIRPDFVGARAQAVTKFVGALRAGEQTFEQGAQVKAGAAYHDWKTPPSCDLGQRRTRLARVLASRKGPAGLGDIDQVMRNAGPIVAWRLGSADFEVAIHSNRIATNNLP